MDGPEWRAQLGQKVARLRASRRPLQAVPEDDAGGGLCKQNHSKVQCWEGGTTQSSPGCDLGSNLGKRNVGRSCDHWDSSVTLGFMINKYPGANREQGSCPVWHTCLFLMLRFETEKSPMAPYHIRQYQDSDSKSVLDLFISGMEEHIPATFHHMLTLPRTLLLLLGVPLAMILVSGSWLLAAMSIFFLLLLLKLLARQPWKEYVAKCLHTDMADITKSYMNAHGSFWVAETGGVVVGIVGCLPVKDPPLGRKQMELFHLSVSSHHRGQGIAKALIRTVIQFARDQGYSDVVLETSVLQQGAEALYVSMGFRRTGQYFMSVFWRFVDILTIQLKHPLPSAYAALGRGNVTVALEATKESNTFGHPWKVPGRYTCLTWMPRFETQKSPMAPYHIRKYQDSDQRSVLDLFIRGMEEHIPATFRRMLTLPRTLFLLLGLPLAMILVSGSWLLAAMSIFFVLLLVKLLARQPWKRYVAKCLHTDMADITKSYMSARGSCFWVAESGGELVGTVGGLPVKDPPLGRKQLELFHLSVSSQHRGQGIAKALIRTLLQFARDQGYSDVVLDTSIMQPGAQALYMSMGFRRTGQYFITVFWRLADIPAIQFKQSFPSA
ncbi:hypothetical protein U0070_003103 [Myodes glareolus]|uniref:N-acetyltransferase domain-containing protein n=1 Tax=Myodes glareolus TaxID=447135 RepID=A0AAW0HLQ5_MYOGA